MTVLFVQRSAYTLSCFWAIRKWRSWVAVSCFIQTWKKAGSDVSHGEPNRKRNSICFLYYISKSTNSLRHAVKICNVRFKTRSLSESSDHGELPYKQAFDRHYWGWGGSVLTTAIFGWPALFCFTGGAGEAPWLTGFDGEGPSVTTHRDRPPNPCDSTIS